MVSFSAWLVWALVGAALIIVEVFTLTFMIFCFGLGAFAASAAALSGADPAYQWGAFLIVSAATLATTLHLMRAHDKKPLRKAGVDRVVGKEGVVIEDIQAPDSGLIRVEHDTWRAVSDSKSVIKKGTHVKVDGIQGTHLIVSVLEEVKE
ncbi:MAG: NfeD family protein [Candidatus Dadabacteria bacterium]|nr:MAG: NfeD family protein [Candidatus Dadabacteria bacterium]